MNSVNVEEWKNSKYLDYNNAFNIIKDTLNAFHDYEMNNKDVLPIKFIDDIKNQEFKFYQLIKEEIALESYRFSLYADDVIICLDMLMKESIELSDLLEILKSLIEDTKIRLNSIENLYNKYEDNDEMKRILDSIVEYGHSLDNDFILQNWLMVLLSLLFNPVKSVKSFLNQSHLLNGNGNQLNLENSFQELISKHEEGLNIICEIKQFWENQVDIINKFINIFEKGDINLLSQKDGQDIRNKWEEEKKNSEIFYHKIRNLLN